MSAKIIIGPKEVSAGKPAYSPAIAYDLGGHRLIFLAGQIAVDEQGNTVAPNDAAEQTRFIFEKIVSLLADTGTTVDDLVRVRIYVTNMNDLPAISTVRNSYLKQSLPASTLVEVGATVRPDCCVEIDAIGIRSL